MRPTLSPGDLLVLHAPTQPLPQLGVLVEVRDPRDGRRLIKRVTAVHPEGFEVRGDNQAASRDSRDFGMLSASHWVAQASLAIRLEPFSVKRRL